MKWNEWGFRPPVCTYRLNWARRTSWGWMRWPDDTTLQTQDSKFGPWGLARYLSVTEVPHNNKYLRVSGEETFCFFETWRPEWGSNPWSPTFQAGRFNHCTMALRDWWAALQWSSSMCIYPDIPEAKIATLISEEPAVITASALNHYYRFFQGYDPFAWLFHFLSQI